jgi:hypothetical protein
VVGKGAQIYDCAAGAWTLREPAAVESFDGSSVLGMLDGRAEAPDPADDIPWLRLKAVPTQGTGSWPGSTSSSGWRPAAAWPRRGPATRRPTPPWPFPTGPATSSTPTERPRFDLDKLANWLTLLVPSRDASSRVRVPGRYMAQPRPPRPRSISRFAIESTMREGQ